MPHKIIMVEEGVIPELEEKMGEIDDGFWSEKQIAVLKRYYKKVEMDDLLKYIGGGKTKNAIQKKASVLGITHKRL